MAHSIKALLPHVGDKPIDRLHNDTLVPFIEARRRAGLASGTINEDLSVVRRVRNLAARVWRDENGLSWLSAPPLINSSERITTNYSAPDIAGLIEAANKVCEPRHTVLRVVATQAVTQKSRTKLTQRAGVARVDLGS
jgi:hypothetical protein